MQLHITAISCGHVHLATSLSHVNHTAVKRRSAETLTTLCSTAVNWSACPPFPDQLTNGALQDFCLFFLRSLHFLKKFPPIALYRRFYRKSSTGNAENSSAEGKPEVFVKIQAWNEVGLGKSICIWLIWMIKNTAVDWKRVKFEIMHAHFPWVLHSSLFPSLHSKFVSFFLKFHCKENTCNHRNQPVWKRKQICKTVHSLKRNLVL